MSYVFRKLYVDVVAPDGTVCVLYLTWLRLAGRWWARSGAERYTADGERTIWQGAEPELVDPEAPLEAFPLVVETGGGVIRFEVDAVHRGWTPSEPCPCADLHWSVKAARTAVTVRSTLPGDHFVIQGTGYADWVHLTRPTRLLGFDELRWGRVHLPDRTIVFDSLSLRSGARWAVGAQWSDDGSAVETPVSVRFDESGCGEVSCIDQSRQVPLVALHPHRVLHAGSAFDRDRIPHLTDRVACRVLGGRTAETRWLGRVSASGSPAETPGSWALYERVRFGHRQ